MSQSSADALAYELFAEDDVRLSSQLSVNAGLYLAHFQVDKTSYQKQAGHLIGWISYSLQWSRRQFDQINGGQWFPFKYDYRHDLDIGGHFQWKDHIDVSWRKLFLHGP